MLFQRQFKWRSGKDLNPRPADWKFRSITNRLMDQATAQRAVSFAIIRSVLDAQ